MTDWTVGKITGVPGGIPTRTTIAFDAVTDGGADPTGAIDCTAITRNLMLNCPEGEVVYFPPGIYKIGNLATYQTGKNKTLRGAGPGKTIFKPTGSVSFRAGVDDAAHTPRAITRGATKGSTAIAVADTSDVTVGELIYIEAAAPPNYIHGKMNPPSPLPDPPPTGSVGGTLGWMFRISAIPSAGHITFYPPLPMDISTLSPQASVLNSYGTGSTIVGIGFEDFTVDKTGNTNGGIMAFDQAYGCWVRNVEFKNFSRDCLTFFGSMNCEARRCYLHGGTTGPGSEGLDLIGRSSWNVIEDNIVYNGGAVVLNDANSQVSGNVIDYNFIYAHHVTSVGLQIADIDLGHGTQDTLNLVEGNVIGSLHGGDSYFGGASHNTLFRNWFTATNPYGHLDGRVAVKLKQANVYTNVVGNVLGTSAFPITNNGVMDDDPSNGQAGFHAATGGYYQAPRVCGYDNGASSGVQIIYELGFPNIGNSGFTGILAATSPPDYSAETIYNSGTPQKFDLNVEATLLRHGNFDYFSRAQVWDAEIADQDIPDSLAYPTGTPEWWPDGWAWPPIDPAFPPLNFTPTGGAPAEADQVIPAVWAFYHQDESGIPKWPPPTYGGLRPAG